MNDNMSDNMRDLIKKAERHKIFLPDDEYNDIDGIPKRIERDIDMSDEYSARKNIEKLGKVANFHGDRDLRKIVNDMQREIDD